jgi:hypothetical protein
MNRGMGEVDQEGLDYSKGGGHPNNDVGTNLIAAVPK